MTIQLKRGTSADLASANPTPAEGEAIFETDTGILKIGDGASAYNDLSEISGGGSDSEVVELDRYDSGWVQKGDFRGLDEDIVHDLGADISDLIWTMSFSPDGTDANAITNTNRDYTGNSISYGWSLHQKDANTVTLSVAGGGIQYTPVGATDNIQIQEQGYYYRFRAWVLPGHGLKGDRGEAGPVGPAEFEWQSDQTYNENYVCSYGGVLYISLADNNLGNPPDTSPAAWSVFADTSRYAVFHHKTAAGVGGGSISNGAWRTGPLNNVQFNGIPGASLNTSTGEFTLPAGTFYIHSLRSVFYVNGYGSRLYDVTNGVTALPGMRGYADQGDGYNNDRIPITGVLSPSAPTTYRVEVWPQTSRSNDGWGFNANSYGGEDGTWATVTIIDLKGMKGEKGDPGVSNPYDPGVTYSIGAVVLWHNKLYVSLVDGNTGNDPELSPSAWQPHEWVSFVWTDAAPDQSEMSEGVLYLEY